jgi:hypothetical protein
MAAPKPKFVDSFGVQRDNYGDFIRLVRQNVIKYCRDRQPAVFQPVLPREEETPKLWFHVVLRTTSSTITVAVRMDNLYLVGFRTPAGVWWEFNNKENSHLIRDARWLGFGDRYYDLVGDKGLETVTLGRAEMTAAVDALAIHGTATSVAPKQGAQSGDSYARPKSMLAKLVIMVCEGVRFHTVYVRVDKEFKEPSGGAKLTELEGKQVNKWDRISKAVLAWAVRPNDKFPELEVVGVKDKNDAARIVALVKDETS